MLWIISEFLLIRIILVQELPIFRPAWIFFLLLILFVGCLGFGLLLAIVGLRQGHLLSRFCAVLSVSVLACAAFWFFRPLHGYDIQHVHPRLRALQQPYQNVKTHLYLDGGSIGIEIIDRNGQREQFALPVEVTVNPANEKWTTAYKQVYIGAILKTDPNAVEITEPENNKWMLASILQVYPKRIYQDDLALMSLGRRPVDVMRCFIEKAAGGK
jgi:hypothetical protein